MFDIVGDIAKLLLHLAHGLIVGRLVEAVAALEKQLKRVIFDVFVLLTSEQSEELETHLDEMLRDVASSNVQPTSEMMHGEGVVNRTNVRDAVTDVYHNARVQSLGEKAQNSLNS